MRTRITLLEGLVLSGILFIIAAITVPIVMRSFPKKAFPGIEYATRAPVTHVQPVTSASTTPSYIPGYVAAIGSGDFHVMTSETSLIPPNTIIPAMGQDELWEHAALPMEKPKDNGWVRCSLKIPDVPITSRTRITGYFEMSGYVAEITSHANHRYANVPAKIKTEPVTIEIFPHKPEAKTAQSQSSPTIEPKATATYQKAGISFQYPSNWHSFPSEAVNGMRTQMTSELRKFNRNLVLLDMFISSDEEVAFFVSQVQADNALSANDILLERRKFYDDAKRTGDVTNINQLEATTANNLPAVVEDVERSNGGRGHTVKMLKGRFIIELSLIVNKKSHYDKHVSEYEQILATLKVQD